MYEFEGVRVRVLQDPDYISEDWKRQDYTEERREKQYALVSMPNIEADLADPSRPSLASVGSSIKRKDEYLEMDRLNFYLVFCDSILGDEFDLFFDRWGRR